MIVELLTKQHLEFLSLTGGCTGSSDSAHVKMPYCSKSHVAARVFSERGQRTSGCKLFLFAWILSLILVHAKNKGAD